ncbi:hypothetical protein DMP23_02935 [Amycolatopsis sp. A1MSW2902]
MPRFTRFRRVCSIAAEESRSSPDFDTLRWRFAEPGGMLRSMTRADLMTARADVSVAPDGRVTIPAQLRQAAGISPGSNLVAYVERGRVVLEDRDHLLQRVQDEAIAAARAAGAAGSVTDSLIADRRAEAAREGSSGNAAASGEQVGGSA